MNQSSAAWQDTAPMPKFEPSLAWPPSTPSSLAAAARRTIESPPKPAIQGLEVKELDGQTVFDQLFGGISDTGSRVRTQP